jgi:hypothetical protein
MNEVSFRAQFRIAEDLAKGSEVWWKVESFILLLGTTSLAPRIAYVKYDTSSMVKFKSPLFQRAT